MKYKINLAVSIFSLFTLFTFSQEIQREVISSQGESVQLDSGVYVTQTIGQHSIATNSMDNLTVQQGYQQSFWNSLINSNEELESNKSDEIQALKKEIELLKSMIKSQK